MAWYQIDPITMVSNALGFLRHILQLLTAFFAYFSELERKMEGSFLKTFILKKQKQTEQRALKELHSLAWLLKKRVTLSPPPQSIPVKQHSSPAWLNSVTGGRLKWAGAGSCASWKEAEGSGSRSFNPVEGSPHGPTLPCGEQTGQPSTEGPSYTLGAGPLRLRGHNCLAIEQRAALLPEERYDATVCF